MAPEGWKHAQHTIASEQEQTARLEQAQRTPFDKILGKLKGATTIDRLKVVYEGKSDVPVYRHLLTQVLDVPEVLFDFIGGRPTLEDKDPEMLLGNCKEVIVVMDGDCGRHLTKANKPLTKAAKKVLQKFRPFPVKLEVLEKYGIENYFPRSAMEAILGCDLSRYYPIPDHVGLAAHMAYRDGSIWYRIRVMIAGLFALPRPSGIRTAYPKSSNAQVAERVALEDLSYTDLLRIINAIAQRAKELGN